MIDHLCAAWDTKGHYFVNVSTGGYGVEVRPDVGAEPAFVAALLNSGLLSWYLRRLSRAWRGGWFEARKGNLRRLPIALPSMTVQQEMIALFKEVAQALRDAEGETPESAASRLATSARETFDHRVATIYGLSAAEYHLVASFR
jgi:hypothetical protein